MSLILLSLPATLLYYFPKKRLLTINLKCQNNKILWKWHKTHNTSSITGESLFNWDDEEEFAILDPVREPLPKLVMKYEVGADPLHVSVWSDIFCWLGEFLLVFNLEFSSSMRFVNSSILSLRAEIWSESWLIAP